MLTTLSAALVLAGCSTTTAATAPPSLTLVTQSGATPGMQGMSSMTGMPEMTAPSGAAADAPAPAGPNALNINNFAFAPATLTIPVGTTVTWTNKDEEPHTVVSNDGTTFHSPGMGINGTFTFTFTNAGTFDYVCSIHPFMHGSVVVTK
ncbi:cupredoxin domain-containing protein [Mycolicibacterium komossense]|uniref:Cupredoxin family copper-binding protein n=1 Tax=Mycolicibacterium komossense TaxID=1779 RepID=A0ABT3CIV2_9MYCO|nr:cupredoxin family copper-binding protein [Mycolicibacterium komossense]